MEHNSIQSGSGFVRRAFGARFAAPAVAVVCALAAGAGFGAGSWAGRSWEPAAVPAGDLQTCSAFSAVDRLVQESTQPDRGPGGSVHRTYDLVGVADALNNARNWQTSAPLHTAVTSYIYALANLGAVSNLGEPVDDVESMNVVVATAGHTVDALCHERLPDLAAATAVSPAAPAVADPGSQAKAGG